MKFIINNEIYDTDMPSGLPVLDFIRDVAGLKGTKSGCREGDCGACTVLLGELRGDEMKYRAVCSCLLPLGKVEAKHILTIEGLSEGGTLNPVQRVMVESNAVQCGFCTPGFIMSMTSFFINSEKLSYRDILNAISGNICRCTGYGSIKRAARRLCDEYTEGLTVKERVSQLVKRGILPEFIHSIPEKIRGLEGRADDDSVKGLLAGGGTDLFVHAPFKLKNMRNVRFISDTGDLVRIYEKDNTVFIGAAVSTEELRTSEIMNRYIRGWEDFLLLISSEQIRSEATVPGNFVNGSPIGDFSVIFLVLDALLITSHKREIPLAHFFTSYKKNLLKKDELIEWVRIEKAEEDFRFNFEKVSKRKYLDIASVNTAALVRVNKNKIVTALISAGGTGPVPLILKETSSFLEGRSLSEETLANTLDNICKDISPISDIRGSAEYKTKLLRNLVAAHFLKLFPDSFTEEAVKEVLI